MKLNKQIVGVAGMAIVAGMLMAPVDGEARGRGLGQGAGGGQQVGMSTLIAGLPMQELSAVEEVGLLKMREEEKLARDVYQVLYTKWNLQVFNNISRSEQQHMDIMKVVLDKYNMADPVVDSSVGVFTDPELQVLYQSLVVKGEQSLVAALQVGATIEDLDIKDLYTQLEQTDNRDIKTVYQNLAKGSRNHLRAFVYQLSLNGAAYEAQFLSAEEISDIITSDRERGRVDENGVQVGGNKNSGRQGRRVGVQKGKRMGKGACVNAAVVTVDSDLLVRGGGSGARNGAGDGTGNGGNGPADGTGNGSGRGTCTNAAVFKVSPELLVRGGGNGGGNGAGDGTGNGGNGPADGTGNGPGTGTCVNA